MARDPQFLTGLTSKCASRHNGVHFLKISTSKSAPKLVCFVHLDLDLCFAPQRHALFEHLVCFVHFDLDMCFAPQRHANALCATTACNFSSLIWPHGSAPAALGSLLLDPPEPQIIGKTQCSATFSTLSRTYIFLLTLSLLWSSLFFSSLTLPTSAFSSVHIVGSLTSKLPSIILTIFIYVYGLMEQWVWNSINSLHCNWIAITILEPYKSYIIYITSNLVSPPPGSCSALWEFARSACGAAARRHGLRAAAAPLRPLGAAVNGGEMSKSCGFSRQKWGF